LKKDRLPEKYNDVNEWLFDDSFGFKKNITDQINNPVDDDSTYTYFKRQFVKDIENNRNYADKKTGFDNLDAALGGLNPGLYAVGAIPALGKTTLAHQIGDQLAEKGDHVIFFSLEMDRFQMVSKSLARMTAKEDVTTALSSLDIRRGYGGERVFNSYEKYQDTAKRMVVIEGDFNLTVDKMREYVEQYMVRNKVDNVVVIVDYLQIIPHDDKRLDDKRRVDDNVKALKQMSRHFNIPLFVISSFNRGNYLSQVDFSSFKESGGIEYTADVVIGLQLDVINKLDDVKAENEKRELAREALMAVPFKIELVVLKNRNGGLFKCKFDYYTKHNYFKAEVKGLPGYRKGISNVIKPALI
jgi:replicative DNA helicase